LTIILSDAEEEEHNYYSNGVHKLQTKTTHKNTKNFCLKYKKKFILKHLKMGDDFSKFSVRVIKKKSSLTMTHHNCFVNFSMRRTVAFEEPIDFRNCVCLFVAYRS